MKDLLHLGVVYWNLILQLLRTNEQFKSIIHETIVIDPCDLQNIVFNSFSCYLHSKQLSRGSLFSDDQLIDEIEDWLRTNGYNANTSESDVIDTNDCDSINCDFSIAYDKCKGILDIQYDIKYTNVIDCYDTNGTTFNHRSHIDDFKNENSFIDNIKIISDGDTVKNRNETVQSEHIIVSGVKKITNFLTNNVFDHFFVNDETTKSDDSVSPIKCDTEYSVYVKDYDTVESNSLFLQLFEITAGVMILADCEQSNDGK